MSSGEGRLDDSFLALKGLHYGFDLFADLGIIIDFRLEILKDLRVYHGFGCHCCVVFGFEGTGDAFLVLSMLFAGKKLIEYSFQFYLVLVTISDY